MEGTFGPRSYSCCDCGVGAESREEGHAVHEFDGFDSLPTGDVGEHGIHEHGRHKGGHLHDLSSAVAAVQDMVRQQCLNHAGLVHHDGVAGGGVGDFGKGIVGWSQDGDVGGHRQ